MLAPKNVSSENNNPETLIENQHYPAGQFNVNCNGDEKSSGVYIYRLQIGTRIFTKKMILFSIASKEFNLNLEKIV